MDYSSTMRPKAMGVKGGKGIGKGECGFGYTEGTIGTTPAPKADFQKTHDADGSSNANTKTG